MNSFTDSVDLLSRAMNVANLRYQVTANNIANAEVPNYKRQVVNFESELKNAFESASDTEHQIKLATSSEGHFTMNRPYDWRSVEPRRVVDWASSTHADGSNVDAEYEASNILKIQMNYRLLTQLQAFEFSQVKIAMKK